MECYANSFNADDSEICLLNPTESNFRHLYKCYTPTTPEANDNRAVNSNCECRNSTRGRCHCPDELSNNHEWNKSTESSKSAKNSADTSGRCDSNCVNTSCDHSMKNENVIGVSSCLSESNMLSPPSRPCQSCQSSQCSGSNKLQEHQKCDKNDEVIAPKRTKQTKDKNRKSKGRSKDVNVNCERKSGSVSKKKNGVVRYSTFPPSSAQAGDGSAVQGLAGDRLPTLVPVTEEHRMVLPDTISLPPEGFVFSESHYGFDESRPLLRRSASEPDLTEERRLKVYGYHGSRRQTAFRWTAHSHCGSVAGSLFRFPRQQSQQQPRQQEVPSASFSLWSASRQDKSLLFCVALTNLCDMLCLSVMAPFFPSEAESKGVNQTMSGWIFGVFALTQFVFAPICGKMIAFVNPQFMFLAGQFFSGGCYILFGFMAYVPSTPSNYTVYFTLCCVLRIFTAMGCCATTTATFAIVAQKYCDNIATVFGILETSTGLGMSLGPAIGGVLYDAGGFVLPFVILGSFMVLMVPVNKCILPDMTQEISTSPPTSVFRLLRVSAVAITCLCIFLGAMVWSALDPTLEPHLALVEGYNLSSTVIGMIFLLMSAMYGIFCPIFGLLCDKIDDTSPMLVGGFFLAGVGVMLLGPSPHLGFPEGYNVLWLNLVALMVLGLALALAIVPTFDKILDAADKAGFEDNLEMYGVVAGMWGSCYALGDFVGPTVCGFLAERFTFHWTMTYIGYCCWTLATLCLMLFLYERTWGPTQVLTCPDHCCIVGRKRGRGKPQKADSASRSQHKYEILREEEDIPTYGNTHGTTYGYTDSEQLPSKPHSNEHINRNADSQSTGSPTYRQMGYADSSLRTRQGKGYGSVGSLDCASPSTSGQQQGRVYVQGVRSASEGDKCGSSSISPFNYYLPSDHQGMGYYQQSLEYEDLASPAQTVNGLSCHHSRSDHLGYGHQNRETLKNRETSKNEQTIKNGETLKNWETSKNGETHVETVKRNEISDKGLNCDDTLCSGDGSEWCKDCSGVTPASQPEDSVLIDSPSMADKCPHVGSYEDRPLLSARTQ